MNVEDVVVVELVQILNADIALSWSLTMDERSHLLVSLPIAAEEWEVGWIILHSGVRCPVIL